ncbi:MAG: phosphotransferase [archaeon]|nr:phosphotransferase [archaeon]
MKFDWAEDFVSKILTYKSNKGRMQGYYNHNYITSFNGIKYLVRIPIRNAEVVDFKRIPEPIVLKYLEDENFDAPRLLYSGKKDFWVHSYIEGVRFNDIYPSNNPFDDWIPINVAEQMKIIHRFNTKKFENFCKDIASSPNSKELLNSSINSIEKLFNLFLAPDLRKFYDKLLVPKDPFNKCKKSIEKLDPRKFTFCHCDIHRKNLILDKNKRNLTFLDWELVLIADPMYDIAIHMHKMRYQIHQEDLFLETYLGKKKDTDEFKYSMEQIKIYQDFERVKSALVDFYRYYNDFQIEKMKKEEVSFFSDYYYNKIKKAWIVWEIDGSGVPTELITDLLTGVIEEI